MGKKRSNRHKKLFHSSLFSLVAVLILALFVLTPFSGVTQEGVKPQLANTLPDLSGIAWIEDDFFLGIHDSKNFQTDKPRVSLLKLPNSEHGLLWHPLEVNWPKPLGLTSDLESIARIPGKSLFILSESGSDRDFTRLFLTEYQGQNLNIISVTDWPIPVENVEGTAIFSLGDQLIFIYAERADNQTNTQINWATLSLNPLAFGQFESVNFKSPAPVGANVRQVSAMDVDSQGRLYIASAFDPDDNNGPFSSVIWKIGKIQENKSGKIELILDATPELLSTVDGFKVEGIAVRESPKQKVEIFIGTDDENYGGALRPILSFYREKTPDLSLG